MNVPFVSINKDAVVSPHYRLQVLNWVEYMDTHASIESSWFEQPQIFIAMFRFI